MSADTVKPIEMVRKKKGTESSDGPSAFGERHGQERCNLLPLVSWCLWFPVSTDGLQ